MEEMSNIFGKCGKSFPISCRFTHMNGLFLMVNCVGKYAVRPMDCLGLEVEWDVARVKPWQFQGQLWGRRKMDVLSLQLAIWEGFECLFFAPGGQLLKVDS